MAKPSLAIAIMQRAKGKADEAEPEVSDEGEPEVMGQDILDALNSKDPVALYEALCALIDFHNAAGE